MRWITSLCVMGSIALFVAGCKDATPEKPKDGAAKSNEYESSLAKLDPEDRKIAEAQKWCPIAKDSRLGSMGKPFKVMIQDQPVFLCCDHCKTRALKDPEKTLAKVEELKKKSATP